MSGQIPAGGRSAVGVRVRPGVLGVRRSEGRPECVKPDVRRLDGSEEKKDACFQCVAALGKLAFR
jgi:hypothetical protein